MNGCACCWTQSGFSEARRNGRGGKRPLHFWTGFGSLPAMSYQPRPIETSRIVLPPELVPLTERLAENAHDLWAAQRLAQGWTFGPQRDDAKKLHPCLIPYDQLPDHEKEYDRIAALGTLKAILKLGYQILPPQP